jgi:hypothetical protein
MADAQVILKREDFPTTTDGELTNLHILSLEWVDISYNDWGAVWKSYRKIGEMLSLTDNPYSDLDL